MERARQSKDGEGGVRKKERGSEREGGRRREREREERER